MEIERILGNLEEKMNGVKEKLDTLDEKVDHLIEFKWQIIGGSVTLSFIASLLVEFFRLRGGV